MSKFVCKTCHSITEPPPEVVFLPEKDEYYRHVIEATSDYLERYSNLFYLHALYRKYNHAITCPVCGTETHLWKEQNEKVVIKGIDIEVDKEE